jgi:hypothetical protein
MKEVVSYLPKAELIVISDAYEPSSLCQPDVFNAILQQFMERELIYHSIANTQGGDDVG